MRLQSQVEARPKEKEAETILAQVPLEPKRFSFREPYSGKVGQKKGGSWSSEKEVSCLPQGEGILERLVKNNCGSWSSPEKEMGGVPEPVPPRLAQALVKSQQSLQG